jgi:putative membrane protein
MRYLYIGLVVLVTAAVLLFKIQNLTTVTVSFLTMSLTMPVSVTIILVYVLGMVSGGALLNLLRLWFQGATRKGG